MQNFDGFLKGLDMNGSSEAGTTLRLNEPILRKLRYLILGTALAVGNPSSIPKVDYPRLPPVEIAVDPGWIISEANQAIMDAARESRANTIDIPSKDYKKWIEDAARKENLDPDLVARIIRKESKWNPKAKSNYALGIMQIKQKTAEEMAGNRDFDLFDAKTNIELGTKYLGRLSKLDYVGDDLANLLAVYNWGMGNYKKKVVDQGLTLKEAMLQGGIVPSETCDYVFRILFEINIYKDVPKESRNEVIELLFNMNLHKSKPKQKYYYAGVKIPGKEKDIH